MISLQMGDKNIESESQLALRTSITMQALERLLPRMRSGDSGTVLSVRDTALGAKRLADMGFVPGARVQMVRSGSPCIVRVEGLCVGLGADHQESITVGR